jgi:hypothetical protein
VPSRHVDASIEAAMNNGSIAKIHHADHDALNILGLYPKWIVIVYGEYLEQHALRVPLA